MKGVKGQRGSPAFNAVSASYTYINTYVNTYFATLTNHYIDPIGFFGGCKLGGLIYSSAGPKDSRHGSSGKRQGPRAAEALLIGEEMNKAE